jgi:hypothetical protein
MKLDVWLFKTLLTILLIPLMLQVYAARIYGGMYTAERIANARNNCMKYEWARQMRDRAVKGAGYWVGLGDEDLWAMIPGQKLGRCIDVTFDRLSKSSKPIGCLVCGTKIMKFGNYPYEPDLINKPWKLTCPSCGAVFPTNDFGKYYKSGIDKDGLFNPAIADKRLLFNMAHPDPKDPLHKFGVDDGYGYIDSAGHAHGYYTYVYWRRVIDGLSSLATAFLYTGDTRYAHKAAVMLDRLADVYPDLDWKPYADKGWYHSDGGSNLGKIGGSIWETDIVRTMADSYDKILSGTVDDAALYDFLAKQGKRYMLPTAKGTRDLFVQNVDNGVLRTAYKAVLSQQVRGNQGMHQIALAACALALNTEPESSQWLDWLFKPDGGKITSLMINQLDHDGGTDEGAPGYTFIWGQLITQLGVLLDSYSYKHNIFKEFPQLSPAYTLAYRMALLGKAVPNAGDAGATGLVDLKGVDPQFMATGFRYTHDPDVAIAAYRANKNSAKNLGLDIYAADPEATSREIQRIAERAGPRPEGGYLMSGYGLALLEVGKGKSAVGLTSNYGRTIKHAHPDMLNFDLFAFNNWLAPDHGYPEFATRWPSNQEWTGTTIAHNLVLVNKKPQKEIWSGHTRVFKQLKNFGMLEVDGKESYPDVDTYRRTLFLVGGQDDADSTAYVVDIFRVNGGNDHVYSFHGPPGQLTSTGLGLTPHPNGTYAGENIQKGAWSEGKFPIGYSHLYNVKADQRPPAQFMLDWKVTEPYRSINPGDDIHLRMYALTAANDVALADGDPPQNKAGNPRTLQYVLMHRVGENLTSTFVSVFEPYRQMPSIKAVRRLDDGKSAYIALQVTKVNGSTDYVIYNTESRQPVKLANGIVLSGTAAFLHEKGNVVQKGVLIDGTSLKYRGAKLKSQGSISGKVIDRNKELTGGGWIIVDTWLPDDGSLNGQQITVDNQNERDATYTIRGIERQGNRSKIRCGPITFIRGDKMNVKDKGRSGADGSGYLYDFEVGAKFVIRGHEVWNKRRGVR